MDYKDTCTPVRLQILAATTEFENGNNLLQKYVLSVCNSNGTFSEECIKATLRLFNGATVNELNDDGYCALHLAVLAENVSMVKMMLNCIQNIDVNIKSYRDEYTALLLAVRCGSLPIVKVLISNEENNRADINIKSACGLSVFHFASGSLLILQYLLAKCDPVNFINNFGYDLLKMAIYEENYIFEYLLQSDAYLNIKKDILDNLVLNASKYGNANTLKMLIDRGANVNAVDRHLNTPFFYLVKFNHFETINFLLSKNVQFNLTDEEGKIVPLLIDLRDNLEKIKCIVYQIEDLKNTYILRSTSLHEAVKNQDLHKVKYLVNQKSDINAIDDFGYTPVSCAAEMGNLDIVRYLITEKADPYVMVNGKTIYHIAAENGHLHVIKFLQDSGVSLKDGSNIQPILCSAASSGNLETFHYFLDHCEDVNVKDEDGHTPIFYASERCPEIVKQLLKRGARMDNSGDNNPIFAVLDSIDEPIEILKLLLQNGANVNAKNEDGYTPLLHSVRWNDSDITRMLIEWKADIHSKCPQGFTALHFECRKFRSKLNDLNCLLENGADVEASFTNGLKPLHCAAISNNVIAQRVLLAKGADKNCQDRSGNTPLHYAAEKGHESFVRRLIRKYVKVDSRNVKGRTPLHLAALKRHSNVVDALLEAGANCDVKDVDGRTPKDIYP